MKNTKGTLLSQSRVWGAFLGNFFEHYDTALFTAIAPFLAPLFFPAESLLSSLIYTYALITIGMLARPIGAILFGKMGDFYSREKALFYSMGGMALVSLGMHSAPPTNQQDTGVLSYLFREVSSKFCRFGRKHGRAIYILEQTPKEHHASTVAYLVLLQWREYCTPLLQ